MARPPAKASPFDRINDALALDGEELKTLAELRAEFPPRGCPLTLVDKNGVAIGDPIEPGAWQDLADRRTGLPPMCPVIPLGIDGDVAHYISPIGQQVSLKGASSGKGPIDFMLCGLVEFLEWAWPRWSAGSDKSAPEVKGYEADLARSALVFAAASLGAFDDADRVRGRGAWLEGDGALTYHAGNRVWYGGRWRPPGAYGDYVYPLRPAMAVPWHLVVVGSDGPGDELAELFRTWNWRRPLIDGRLLLGWNAMAMLGGALRWRAMAFLTGEAGSGKSTLDGVLQALHGRGLLASGDATGPSLYQKLKHDCTPVELDELEALAERGQRAVDVIGLIRRASSGAKINRGSSEGTSREYTCRSAFLCSAINIPPLSRADQSRFAILQLQPFEEGAAEPTIDLKRIGELGRQLLRRMLDAWPSWETTLQTFRVALREAGHDGRAADQFGALIAAEHMARFDGAPEEAQLAEWAGVLAVDSDGRRSRAGGLLAPLTLGETAGKTADWMDCLNQCLDVVPDAFKHRVQLRTLGQVLEQFRRNPAGLVDAEDACKACGLALTFPKDAKQVHDWSTAELFLPANHPEVRKLFAGTNWQGASGSVGVWFTTLQRAPDEVARVGSCGKGLDKKRHGIFVKLAAAFPAGADEDREAA